MTHQTDKFFMVVIITCGAVKVFKLAEQPNVFTIKQAALIIEVTPNISIDILKDRFGIFSFDIFDVSTNKDVLKFIVSSFPS